MTQMIKHYTFLCKNVLQEMRLQAICIGQIIKRKQATLQKSQFNQAMKAMKRKQQNTVNRQVRYFNFSMSHTDQRMIRFYPSITLLAYILRKQNIHTHSLHFCAKISVLLHNLKLSMKATLGWLPKSSSYTTVFPPEVDSPQ